MNHHWYGQDKAISEKCGRIDWICSFRCWLWRYGDHTSFIADGGECSSGGKNPRGQSGRGLFVCQSQWGQRDKFLPFPCLHACRSCIKTVSWRRTDVSRRTFALVSLKLSSLYAMVRTLGNCGIWRLVWTLWQTKKSLILQECYPCA